MSNFAIEGRRKAGKPMTTVRDCVSTFVSDKPLLNELGQDNFKH